MKTNPQPIRKNAISSSSNRSTTPKRGVGPSFAKPGNLFQANLEDKMARLRRRAARPIVKYECHPFYSCASNHRPRIRRPSLPPPIFYSNFNRS
ncbi:hypothetical protein CDAR_455301 [Caerostris darwini]|uniref:Uncharacterized protein n=1 Tax=Caerostris darwini TaxID=1538125 RepID=A0AAV4PB23_9ARAC|nr:hypothetical protein CDAR_455301 [Caerostris darwini]